MATALVVPDASVILKWVLPPADEADVGRALALRDAIGNGDVQALVPELRLYEVGNTLARRLPGRAERLLPSLLRFDLPTAPPSRRWLNQALDFDATLRRDVLRRRLPCTRDLGARRLRHCRRALLPASPRGAGRRAAGRVEDR